MEQEPDNQQALSEQVTTEPQRRALEAMSQELVDKLHKMVEEQQLRAQEFAAHQHSLSSLPATPMMPNVPEVASSPAPQWKGPVQYAPQHKLPPLPNVPLPRAPQYTYANREETLPEHRPQPRPKQTRNTEEDTENTDATIGAGAIIFILAVVFIIMSRGCS